MKKIYLDNAATTRVDPRVIEEVGYGNTMSLHSLGQEAKIALDDGRQTVAQILGAKADEIIFTGSATESNNFALKGTAWANSSKGRHIIISSIEHPCVMESALWLEKQGFEITRLPVDTFGRINLQDLIDAIKEETILVSIIYGSNEIGTIQPIREIAEICHQKGVYFHTDATQILGKEKIDLDKISLLTASSHKIYGPKGAGLLYIKRGVKIEPLLHGGGQEFNKRASTVNLPAIVGFTKAYQIATDEMEEENKRIGELRDKLIKGILKIEGSSLNGDPVNRLSNNINVRFDYIEGESLVMMLDLLGIATSTGSACSSDKLEPSHVLLAIGLKPQEAHGSLRVSLGRWTNQEEVDYLLEVLPGVVSKLREISPLGKR